MVKTVATDVCIIALVVASASSAPSALGQTAERQRPAADDPRTVIEQFFSAYRAVDVERLVSLFAADIEFEDPTFRLREVGREAMRTMATNMRGAYSDVTIDVHSMLVDGDAVAAEVTIAAVMTRADGAKRPIKVRGASFFRVRNGQIRKWTDYFDFRTFSEQTRTGG
jgi:steroid delta-isomerase-like uncharacterized protein